VNNIRDHYNAKYDGEYKNMYCIYRREDGIIATPEHYHTCAKYIKDVLKIYINCRILEVGCGTGALLWRLKNEGYNNIYGIDISDRAIEYSIMPDITYRCELADIFFKNNFFDLVVSIGTYEHLTKEDFDISLKEITRVGKKAVLWIDKDKGNSDHIFNEDPEWWARKIAEVTDAESIFVDKDMEGGSGTNPILINFDLDETLWGRDFIVIKERGDRI